MSDIATLINETPEAGEIRTGTVTEVVDATHVKVNLGDKVRTVFVPAEMAGVSVGQEVTVRLDVNVATLIGGGTNPPIGSVTLWAGSAAAVPGNYLLCDGSAKSRTTYAKLFAAIGTTWGVGDGSTTFNVPPGGIFPVGYKAADANFGTAGGTGGSKDAIVVSHSHSTNATRVYKSSTGTADESIANGSGFTLSFDWDVPTASAGSSGTNKNLPPFGVFPMIIRAF